MTLQVNEIFYSIQGESSHAGRPCVFVRLSGCNLRCSYCDTTYAYENGLEMDLIEIMKQVDSFQCPLVEITGGEPLLQKETPSLITALLETGKQVLLETNGSLDIRPVDDRCVKIIDVKCPSSHEWEHCRMENLKCLSHRDELKFVIGNRQDYEYAKQIIAVLRRDPLFKNPILLSPVYDAMDPAVLVQWILADHLDVTLNLQLHKIIWAPDQSGV